MRHRSARRLIGYVAECLGVNLRKSDFSAFVKVESEFQSLATGTDKGRNLFALRWILFDRPSFLVFHKLGRLGQTVSLRAIRFISRISRAAVRKVARSPGTASM